MLCHLQVMVLTSSLLLSYYMHGLIGFSPFGSLKYISPIFWLASQTICLFTFSLLVIIVQSRLLGLGPVRGALCVLRAHSCMAFSVMMINCDDDF